jgi:hypothetical protein
MSNHTKLACQASRFRMQNTCKNMTAGHKTHMLRKLQIYTTWSICTECTKHHEHIMNINSSGHGLQSVKSIPLGCWSMLTPMLPTVVSSWLGVLWLVDHSWFTRDTVTRQKPSICTVTSIKYHSFHLDSPGPSMSWEEHSCIVHSVYITLL